MCTRWRSVPRRRGLQRRPFEVESEQRDAYGLQCVFPSAHSLHRVFARHRALRLRMGIMGECGAQTRDLGWFRPSLLLHLAFACHRALRLRMGIMVCSVRWRPRSMQVLPRPVQLKVSHLLSVSPERQALQVSEAVLGTDSSSHAATAFGVSAARPLGR